MRPKYLWPVLLGLAAGCGGGSDVTDGTSESGESATADTATDSSSTSTEGETATTEGSGSGDAATTEAPPAKKVPVERPVADDFELADLDGGKHSVAGYKGKVILLAFWGID